MIQRILTKFKHGVLHHAFCFFTSLLLIAFEQFLQIEVTFVHFRLMAKRGIILMNLGSPDSTEVKDVRKYLMQFLMDERVIDYPYILRLMLVGGIIAPFRAPKSAKAYKSV